MRAGVMAGGFLLYSVRCRRRDAWVPTLGRTFGGLGRTVRLSRISSTWASRNRMIPPAVVLKWGHFHKLP